MTEMLFLFTFGPVQSFIAEARRGQDLFVGSHILSELAKAALDELVKQGAKPIYPSPDTQHKPNKLVLRADSAITPNLGQAARDALYQRWQQFVQKARNQAECWQPAPDAVWDQTWQRQVKDIWDCYWVAAPIGDQYGDAYGEANRWLDATKRVRPFSQSYEEGLKDNLSGRRSALRTESHNAKAYWTAISRQKGITGAKLRPEGKERLDAIGCIKRFSVPTDKISTDRIPSVSSVASEDFLQSAKLAAQNELQAYRAAVDNLSLYRVQADVDWPYDGDLFFLETLTDERLKDSYGTVITPEALNQAQSMLRKLHKQVGYAPRPYYAIVALDGDDIGRRISKCKTPEEHAAFSAQVNQFSEQVKAIVVKQYGTLVYAGGDDVLALLPVSKAMGTAHELADRFHQLLKDNSASAGIAIAHHLYPLGLALEEARQAERNAKQVSGKRALAVHALKRGGETLRVSTKWGRVEAFNQAVAVIQNGTLSSKFAYDLRDSARAFASTDDAFCAEIKRLIGRHKMAPRDADVPELQVVEFNRILIEWARSLPSAEAFSDWMVLARFIAQGGAE